VALMTAILAPVMIMTLAMGIEVTLWSLTKVELQRIADVAAWAGARQYVVAANAQSATNTAADLAEINGASGTATRTWNATTSTTTDNSITAQVVAGVKNAADTAIKVTVTRSIAKSFSSIFSGAQGAETISATAVAEIVSAVAGPQPCLLALKGDGAGVTTGNDITLQGSANVTASNCSVRSDAGISLGGSSSLNVDGTYAGGSITVKGSAAITGGQYQNSGQISDPYANYAPLQSAFSSLVSGQGSAVNISGSGTTTLSPGTYSSLSVAGSSSVTLNPGLYTVNGPVNFGGSATITGTGVTIVSSGTLSYAGSASISLTAPVSGASSGIPGILFASQSSSDSSFLGSSSNPFGGVIYYPNGNITFGGSSSGGSTGCSEVIAGVITIYGSSNLSANCASYGTLNFGSLPSTTSIALVQ
jgi:Flp pilus assembly protein TadG